MPISAQIAESLVHSSWIRKMFEVGLKLKREHGEQNVCDFSLGNPDLPSPPEFDEALRLEAVQTGSFVHGYMPNAGYQETRMAVAKTLARDTGIPYHYDHIVMTCGAAGAINVLLKSILQPGEEVIVIAPYFVEYGFYIANHGGVKVVSPASADLLPDVNDLSNRIGQRTRAVIINSPNNPSGRFYDSPILREIGRLLREKNNELQRIIYLIADEPYKKILYDGRSYESPAKFYRHTLLATSFSKDLSLAGERIGYLAVSPLAADSRDLLNAATFCNRILGYINANALMQRVIRTVLDARVDVDIYRRRRDLLCENLREIGYDVIKPEGTFYMFPRAPIDDDIRFVKALQKELILTTPGSGFDRSGHFRIAFCVDDNVIRKALLGFRTVFNRYRKQKVQSKVE